MDRLHKDDPRCSVVCMLNRRVDPGAAVYTELIYSRE
jgi:hypothetical protein